MNTFLNLWEVDTSLLYHLASSTKDKKTEDTSENYIYQNTIKEFLILTVNSWTLVRF